MKQYGHRGLNDKIIKQNKKVSSIFFLLFVNICLWISQIAIHRAKTVKLVEMFFFLLIIYEVSFVCETFPAVEERKKKNKTKTQIL